MIAKKIPKNKIFQHTLDMFIKCIGYYKRQTMRKRSEMKEEIEKISREMAVARVSASQNMVERRRKIKHKQMEQCEFN